MIILGSGTSHGVPLIGCDCPVCNSTDPKDNRTRCSAFIPDENILVDCGPEFRIQAIRTKISRLSGVFITHDHADHLHGLDDLRIFSHTRSDNVEKKNNETPETLKLYSNCNVIRHIKKRFDYIFADSQLGGGKPKLDLVEIFSSSVQIGNIQVTPVPMLHGNLETTGFVFTNTAEGKMGKSIAYLTDCSFIPEKSFELLKEFQIEHLVIDALRERVHPTHFNFGQAMEAADRIGPRHTHFTHITHNFSHVQICQWIESNVGKYTNLSAILNKGGSVSPCFDGQVLEV